MVSCGVSRSGSCAGVAFDDDDAAGMSILHRWASVCSREGCRGAYEGMIWVRVRLRMMGMDSSFSGMQASVVVGTDCGCDRSAVLMIIGNDDCKGASAGGSAWVLVGGSKALCVACLARRGPAFACSSGQVGFVMIMPVSNAAQGQQQSSR